MTSGVGSSSNDMKQRRRVCLFGLSADPPTSDGGHGGIVKSLANESFDEVRIIPVYQHTFSEKRDRMASYRDRVEMCRLAFAGIPHVTVSEVERTCFEKKASGLSDCEKASLRVGTADLLDMLLEEEPESDFYFALGADTFVDLTSWKWRRSRDVLDLLQGRFVVVYRTMEDPKRQVSLDAIKKQVAKVAEQYPGNQRILCIPGLEAVSSTQVRACKNEALLREMVDASVLLYIRENKLYDFED